MVAANQAEKLGMPKAKYPLMFATMLMCISPKSGSFDKTRAKVSEDAKHPSQHPMPRGLRDMHYKHSEEITGGWLNEDTVWPASPDCQAELHAQGVTGAALLLSKR